MENENENQHVGSLKQIKTVIEEFMAENEWKYTFDNELELFKLGIEISGKIKYLSLFILPEEESLITLAVISLNADEECRGAVSEFITRANYGIRCGNFEMDYMDGEIRYKVFMNFPPGGFVKEILERSILTGVFMFEKYGDALLSVMFGFNNPEVALAEAEEKYVKSV